MSKIVFEIPIRSVASLRSGFDQLENMARAAQILGQPLPLFQIQPGAEKHFPRIEQATRRIMRHDKTVAREIAPPSPGTEQPQLADPDTPRAMAGLQQNDAELPYPFIKAAARAGL